MTSKLHLEFQFRNGVVAKNRFALAPMTNSQSLQNGKLGYHEFLWLKQFAQGGFGIIITSASHVSLEGQGWKNQIGIFDDSFIPSLKSLTQTIKSYGALAILQIYHGGLRSPQEILQHSPLDLNTLNIKKIQNVASEFGNAAYRAEQAGFDGIEIHGANGYLITQFISTQTNHRNDLYGGSLENRARFLLDILKDCRQKVSSKFIIGTRLSPENFGSQTGLKLEETLEISKWLSENGNDYLHISTWDALQSHLLPAFNQKLPNNYPIFIAGGLTSSHECDNAIELGASFVSLGKIAIGNPYFPIRSIGKNYKPNLPPFRENYLKNCHVSSVFKKLLYNFHNFLDK